jgi:hypothetical protein
MKNHYLIFQVLVVCFSGFTSQIGETAAQTYSSTSETSIHTQDSILSYCFSHHVSDVQVQGQGVVVKVLPDDNSGSRHQRFIVKLSSGQTVLIAHNIDIAPRIGSLRTGNKVKFYGEYEWNEQGGVVHWTHGDPDGGHEAGWLECRGKRYQ